MKVKENLETTISFIVNRKKRKTISLAKKMKGLNALEVGGPSQIFGLRSFFPVYIFLKNVDGVNFSEQTVWEGNIEQGNFYSYLPSKPKGFQYIDEASLLNQIKDNKYDVLISSHCLEHVANPLKAIENWIRVIKPGGKICIIVPYKETMFDHNRPFTSFEHILQDYKNNTPESDETHFKESIELTDLSHPALKKKSKKEFEELVKNNFLNRCVHHHVFNCEVLQKMFNFFHCDIIHNEVYCNSQLLIVAEKR